MASSTDLAINAEIKFHDPFPRSAYVAVCVADRREFTEEGYLLWRDTCERLSGDMSTERRIEKLGHQLQGAFAELGVSATKAAAALGAIGIALAPKPGIVKADR